MTVVVNGSDPDIYLTNGTRESLGLVGESTRPQSIVQAAQDGYFAATGAWPYVQGMPNTPGKPPEPPVEKALGKCTISGSGISGGSVSLTVGDTLDLAAARDGDANPVTYKWSVRSGDAISFVGVTSKAAAQITATKAGMATFRCMFTATATDSPQEVTVSVVVAEAALGLSAEVTKAPSTTPDDDETPPAVVRPSLLELYWTKAHH